MAFICVGSMFIGIGNSPSRDAPNGSPGLVSVGIFLIVIAVILIFCKIISDRFGAMPTSKSNTVADTAKKDLYFDIKELQNMKGRYILKAESHDCGDEMKAYYDDFQVKVDQYMLQMYDTALALCRNQKALESHKIDPYIAGGAANALGGPVMGVATAISASERNKSIQNNRAYCAQSVSENKMKQDNLEIELKRIIKSINDLYKSCMLDE